MSELRVSEEYGFTLVEHLVNVVATWTSMPISVPRDEILEYHANVVGPALLGLIREVEAVAGDQALQAQFVRGCAREIRETVSERAAGDRW